MVYPDCQVITAGSAVVAAQTLEDLHNPDTAGIAGTVNRSDQVLVHPPMAVVGLRKATVAVRVLAVVTAVGMGQGVVAGGRC